MPEPISPGEARLIMQMADHDVAVRAYDEEREDRNKWRRIWLGVAVAALFGAIWMGRYEVIPANGVAHLRLDRWTGSVNICGGTAEKGKCAELKAP